MSSFLLDIKYHNITLRINYIDFNFSPLVIVHW